MTSEVDSGQPFRSLFGLGIVQLTAYALLIGAGFLSFFLEHDVWMVALAEFVVLVAFLVCWPFRGKMIDRLISLVVGVISMAIALLALHNVPKRSRYVAIGMNNVDTAVHPYAFWAVGFVVLLVALTVFGFGRQMVRERRSHLVRALSHSLSSGVAAASVAGWAFLPEVLTHMESGNRGGETTVELTTSLLFAIVLVLLLSSLSYLWWKEPDPDSTVPLPWVGFALLPTMFSGMVVYGVGLVTLAFSAY